MSELLQDADATKINWGEGQELTGASDMQVAFAKALCRGASKTQAAKQAGYKGEGSGLRGLASRMSKSHKVMALIAWAKAGGAGPSEIEGDPKELRRILWRHARSQDATRSIRASEVLHKLDADEKARAAAAEDQPNPAGALAEIAQGSTGWLALVLGLTHSIELPDSVAALTRADVHRQLDAVRRLVDWHFDGRKPSAFVAAACDPGSPYVGAPNPPGMKWNGKEWISADTPAKPASEATANPGPRANGSAKPVTADGADAADVNANRFDPMGNEKQ
jgi:hypothetical protein